MDEALLLQADRFFFFVADFAECLDDVFGGIGHIMQFDGDRILVVIQSDDRFGSTVCQFLAAM